MASFNSFMTFSYRNVLENPEGETFYITIISMKAVDEFNNSMRGKKPAKCKVIVSSHNYQNTPSVEDLGNLVAIIQASGADIVKIATTALDITDVARVFQISVHSQVSGVSSVANLCS